MSEERRALEVLGELPPREVVGEATSLRLGSMGAGRLAWWHRWLFERIGEDNPFGEPVAPGPRGELAGSYRAVERTRPVAPRRPASPPPVEPPAEPAEELDRSPPKPAASSRPRATGRMRLEKATRATAPTVRKLAREEGPERAAPEPIKRELPNNDAGLDDLFGFSEGGRFTGE